MPLDESRVSFSRRIDVWQETRAVQPRSRVYRLERSSLGALYFIPVESCHPYRGNLASLLAEVQVRGPSYFHAAIGQVHAAFCVMRESRKELVADGNNLVGLLAFLSDPARHDYVAAFSIYASIRIAR